MRAGGRHKDARVTAALTGIAIFLAPYLFPYFPTVQAAVSVLFLGIELSLDAIWESSKTLVWHEWTAVVGTVLGCCFLGFAPGIGLGLFVLLVMEFYVLCIDSVMSFESCPGING